MAPRLFAALVLSVVTSACAKDPAANTSVADIAEGDAFRDDIEAVNLTGNLRRIRFASGSAALDERARWELDRAARLLRDNPSVRVVVVGHTDRSGSEDHNRKLGLSRAKAVERYLENHGVHPSAVMATSAGETDPLIEPGSNMELRRTWAINRRVEFRVAWDPNDVVDGSEDNFPSGVIDVFTEEDGAADDGS